MFKRSLVIMLTLLVLMQLFSFATYAHPADPIKKVVFISDKAESVKTNKIDILNVTVGELEKAKSALDRDTIWVKDVTLKNENIKNYLQQKVQEGTRIYFIKTGFSIEDAFTYLNINNHGLKTGDGSSPTSEQITPISTEVLGIQKLDNAYAIYVLRFEKPEYGLIINTLIEDTYKDPLKAFCNNSGEVSIQAYEDWPIAYINAVTDTYAAGKVAFTYKLSEHPNNPYNYKNYYVGRETLEITPFYSSSPGYSTDYAYATISAGSNGKVYDYDPASDGAESSSSFVVTLPFSISWYWSTDLGSGINLKISKYSGDIGGTWIKWKGEPVDLLDRHLTTIKKMTLEPGIEFYVSPSEAQARAYSSYQVYFKDKYGTSSYCSNSYDTWVSN